MNYEAMLTIFGWVAGIWALKRIIFYLVGVWLKFIKGA